MKNGAIILTAIALLFLGMYVYSYSFEYFQKLKENRKLRKQLEKEELINQQKAFNKKSREEYSQKLSQRSNEIKDELKRLAEFKSKIQNRQIVK
jgi:hypothetical protein